MDVGLLLHLSHWAIAIMVGIACVRYWARTRFWLPRYVHVLAAIALVPGGLIVLLAAGDPVGRRHLPLAAAIALSFPAFVYFAFVFFGGQKAAHDSRLSALGTRCPGCGALNPPAPPAANPMENRCARCGRFMD